MGTLRKKEFYEEKLFHSEKFEKKCLYFIFGVFVTR